MTKAFPGIVFSNGQDYQQDISEKNLIHKNDWEKKKKKKKSFVNLVGLGCMSFILTEEKLEIRY